MFRNLLGFGEMLSHWRQRERQKTLQIQGLRLGPVRFPPACRPIHFEKPDDAAPHPDACSYDSRESAEAQFPLRKELEIAQQQVHQKTGPDLPLDRVLVVPDEVTELTCLFELFEEQLDCPSRSVEFGHGPCGPVAVVREEGRSPHPPSDLDHRRDAPKRAIARRVLSRRSLPRRAHDLVPEDLRGLGVRVEFSRILKRFQRLHHEVCLLAHDEEHVPERERVEESEVRVRPVGDEDVPVSEVCRHGLRPFGVVMSGVFDDRERRQEVSGQIVHVEFRRRLPGTVSRPVNAVEDELNRARVEEVDVAFLETGEYGWVSDADEFRAEAAEIVQHLPVQRLHHRRIAVLVGVRECVAPRRNRATQLLPLGGVEPRRVADAVERLRLRELLVDERDDMAPRRERPREVLCCGRRRMKNIRRDEVDYLPEDGVYCLRCFWWCLFLHKPVGYRITPSVATLNIHPIANAVSEWDANDLSIDWC